MSSADESRGDRSGPESEIIGAGLLLKIEGAVCIRDHDFIICVDRRAPGSRRSRSRRREVVVDRVGDRLARAVAVQKIDHIGVNRRGHRDVDGSRPALIERLSGEASKVDRCHQSEVRRAVTARHLSPP